MCNCLPCRSRCRCHGSTAGRLRFQHTYNARPVAQRSRLLSWALPFSKIFFRDFVFQSDRSFLVRPRRLP